MDINRKYYFISDLHFGYNDYKSEIPLIYKFENLLKELCTNNGTLFILGDLFDYWFEYKTVVQKYSHRIITALEDLRNNGNTIYYIIGNHDFAHLNFFEKDLDIKLNENPIDINIEGYNFHLHHGDGLDINDKGYLFIKKILRRKSFQRYYSSLHPSLGIKIASGFSKKSRKYTDKNGTKNFEYLYKYAENKINNGFEYIIMGHTHKREILPIKNGYYVNLGSWFNNPAVGIFEDGNFYFKELL